MNKFYIFLSAFILTLSSELSAQTDFSLSGLGRVIVSHDKINGNINKGDTITPNKGMGGYILFDLKPTLRVNENLHANAILRVKNQFGSFFGDGTDFQFRQLQIMGRLGNKISYQLGDINVQMTPYTVFAFPEMYHEYEADIFAIRRSIANYENFVIGNAWRLQGAQSFANFSFGKGIESLSVNTFAVRTNPTDDIFVPDRILAGTRILAKQSSMFSLGGNYVGMLDIPLENSLVNYTNHVMTGDGEFTMDKETLLLKVKGETGLSSYDYYKDSEKKSVSYNDFFYTAEASAVYKPLKMKLFASYRDVGPQFSSPSAQTRRINVTTIPTLFSVAGGADRQQVLFDRFTQEGIYNQAVNPVLYPFLPWYNNITPYGDATPNRRGISGGIATDTSLKVLRAEARVDLLNEIIGEGISDLRKFMGIRGGVVLNVDKVIGWEKRLALNGGIRMEKTTRSGLAAVDFSSTLIDAGTAIEVVKNIDILAGAKMLSAKGNEYIAQRDEFNLLQSFPPVTVNLSEAIYSFGGRIRFANSSYFTINYNISSNKYPNNTAVNYNINQLFFNYTLIIP
jgi:hypothetical protein